MQHNTLCREGKFMAEKMILMLPLIAEKREEFIGVINSALPDTRAFEGNLKVDVWVPEDDEGALWLYEEWESREHQARYFQWRMDTGLMDVLGPFLSGAPRIAWITERN
jgi:quinol monooxygenase YgiN